jgi:hypothetical protein
MRKIAWITEDDVRLVLALHKRNTKIYPYCMNVLEQYDGRINQYVSIQWGFPAQIRAARSIIEDILIEHKLIDNNKLIEPV